MSLNTIFNKDVVPLNIISNILLYGQEMSSMNGKDSGEGVMNRNPLYKTITNFSCHVEMGAIPSNNLRLSTISKFSITDLPNESKSFAPSHHQMRPIFCLFRSFTSHYLDVSRQKAYFCSHWELFGAISLDCCIMLKLEGFINCDCCPRYSINCHFFSFVMVEAS